jgi:hypothetical protein
MYVVHVIMHAFECLKVHSHMWEFFFPNTIHIDIQSSPPPCFFILVFACLLKICKYEYYNIMFNTSINSSYCLCYIFLSFPNATVCIDILCNFYSAVINLSTIPHMVGDISVISSYTMTD